MRTRHMRNIIFSAIFTILFLGATASFAQTEKKLKYTLGIETSQGFSEMIPANKNLPTIYSETFANYLDGQKSIAITLSQKHPEGIEKIADVSIEIPAKPKATVKVILTLKIDADRKLVVKAVVMETGAVTEFGPYPVQ